MTEIKKVMKKPKDKRREKKKLPDARKGTLFMQYDSNIANWDWLNGGNPIF